MPNSDARMARGLSIAVVVLSCLAILAGFVALFFLGVGTVALNDPSVADATSSELDSDPQLADELDQYNLDSQDVLSFAAFSLVVGVAAVLGSMVLSVVTLVAGIAGIRRSSKPEKAGVAFGWAIAGAVAAFLTGRIVTVVLLVVAAVYFNKLKRAAQCPFPGQAYPAQPYAAAQPWQPHPAQPASPAPASAPLQPAPAQACAPQEPMPPEQPQPPAAPEQRS